MSYRLKFYNLISDFEELEGKEFPVWHPNDFFAKDINELKFLMNFTRVKFKSENIAVLIDEIDASDVGGILGQMSNRFNPRDN